MRRLFSLLTLAVIVFGVTSSSWAQPVTGSEGRAGAPEGRLTFAVAITLAPTFFDPAETPGVITPFLMLYAIHDLDGGHPRLQGGGATALVAVERELHVLTPLRSTNSYVSPSLDIVHDSARPGAHGLPGIGFTIASWIT